jgi:acyl-CoA thioesterase-1
MNKFRRLHDRLEEKASDVRARPVIYVAFGDSVTQGCMEYATIEPNNVFHHLLKKAIEKRYPSTVISVINSGVSGDTGHASRSRWERDIFMYQPDLITIGFGVNDAHEGKEGLANYIESMQELIHHIRSQTEANVLLLTPNMLMKKDNPNIHEKDRPVIPRFIQTAQSEYLPLYVEALRELARAEDVPFVDQYAMWDHMERQGIDIHTRLSNGINHPDRAFHQELADRIEIRLFESNDRR